VRKNGKFIDVQWSKVIIGDICCVHEEELFPADLILFTSSN
jgi:magnesium-transporting ATPase (P-type)